MGLFYGILDFSKGYGSLLLDMGLFYGIWVSFMRYESLVWDMGLFYGSSALNDQSATHCLTQPTSTSSQQPLVTLQHCRCIYVYICMCKCCGVLQCGAVCSSV